MVSAPTSQASLLAFTSAAMLNLSAESVADPTSDNIDMLGLDFTADMHIGNLLMHLNIMEEEDDGCVVEEEEGETMGVDSEQWDKEFDNDSEYDMEEEEDELVDEEQIAIDDDLEREFEMMRGVTGGEFTPDMNIGNFLMHFLSMEGHDEDLIDENDESLDAVASSQLEPQDDPDLGEIDPREIRIAEEELQQETTADPYYDDAILESWSNGSSNIHYSRSHAENDHVLGLPVPPIPSRKRLATHNLELFPYLDMRIIIRHFQLFKMKCIQKRDNSVHWYFQFL